VSSRKDKGDAAEKARQRYWESRGAVVFPVSPSYPGVDLIVFEPREGWIVLSEVKGQAVPLYGKARTEAVTKLFAAVRMVERLGFRVRGEIVHLRDDKWEVLG
jgi:hypothetical protein